MVEWKKLRVLGQSSYGTVYLATILSEEYNSTIVVVKNSNPSSFSLASLQKEKKILDLFKGCKEILQCYFYQYTIERGCLTYNIFMEFAPHGSLGDLIKKGPLPEKDVIIYTHMLLKGLSCIHEKGLVHCDFKPDNILLFPSSDDDAMYQLKIADFGLSRTRGEIDGEWGKIKFRGTPFYMSPESMVGLIETSLDIWSLGCIVIEMITGFPAWSNVYSKQDLTRKLAFLHEPPKIPNGISWDCRNFLNKCLIDHNLRWSAIMLFDHPFIQRKYPSPMYITSSFFSYDIVSYV